MDASPVSEDADLQALSPKPESSILERGHVQPGVNGRETSRLVEGGGRGLQVMHVKDLLNMKEPQWLIQGVISKGALACVYALPGGGKTFLMLDISLSLACGIDWHGRATSACSVLYVAAEGLSGLPGRLRAWAHAHNLGPDKLDDKFMVLDSTINLLDHDAVEALLDCLRSLSPKPGLVVIDTLARSMAGGDENSSKDLGLLINACDRVRKELGATVVLVHHARKDGAVERGSSALRGAADAMLRLEKRDDQVTLHCEKQKDAAEFEPIHFWLRVVPIPGGPTGHVEGISCVLSPGGPGLRQGGDSHASLTETDRKILTSLSRQEGGDSATRRDLEQRCEFNKATLCRHVTSLLSRGYIVENRHGGVGNLFLTDNGRRAVSRSLMESQEPRDTSVSQSHPPFRGGDDETESPLEGDAE